MFVENIVLQYYTIDELQIPDHNDKMRQAELHRQLFSNFEFRLLNNALQLIVCKKAAM